tara:strand:- start:1624 stop:1992 length:369 start_codon:yes stop_codon:yes gene_type:complete
MSDEQELEAGKRAQIEANKMNYELQYASLTVEVGGKTYQADSGSIEQIIKNLSFTNLPDGFYWVDSSNEKVTTDKAGLQAIADAALLARLNLFKQFQETRIAINNVTSVDELGDLIDYRPED